MAWIANQFSIFHIHVFNQYFNSLKEKSSDPVYLPKYYTEKDKNKQVFSTSQRLITVRLSSSIHKTGDRKECLSGAKEIACHQWDEIIAA